MMQRSLLVDQFEPFQTPVAGGARSAAHLDDPQLAHHAAPSRDTDFLAARPFRHPIIHNHCIVVVLLLTFCTVVGSWPDQLRAPCAHTATPHSGSSRAMVAAPRVLWHVCRGHQAQVHSLSQLLMASTQTQWTWRGGCSDRSTAGARKSSCWRMALQSLQRSGRRCLMSWGSLCLQVRLCRMRAMRRCFFSIARPRARLQPL